LESGCLVARTSRSRQRSRDLRARNEPIPPSDPVLDERPEPRPSADVHPQTAARARNDRPGIDGERVDFFDFYDATRRDLIDL
jgi:hypothetical protein